MAAPSVHTTPEHWTELIAARAQRHNLSLQVEELKRSCADGCQKSHVSECTSCYGKVIESMRRRYTHSDHREWFTERKAFLQELDDLFADAIDHKTSLKSIEARIESEKEAWYRWVLRKYPEYLAVCNDITHQDQLRSMLDDPDRSREEVVNMMWQGIGKPEHWADEVNAFAEKVYRATGDREAAIRKLYADEFFRDKKTGQVLEHANPYLEEFETNKLVQIEEVIGKLAHDIQEARNTQPQRDIHERRLDDLRRARLALEQNKKQSKSQAQMAPDQTAGEDLYDLPPCSVCATAVDINNILSCSVCQATTQMGGRKKLTAYCSEKCYYAGHEKHTEEEHDCEGGEVCVQHLDEDVVMEDGGSTDAFVCKECVDQKLITIFCSERCALENIPGHRQSKHGVKTPAEESPSLIASLSSVVEEVLQRENPGLKMEAFP